MSPFSNRPRSRTTRKHHPVRKPDHRKTRFSLKIHPELRAVFQRIGTPPQLPFTPDDFQLEALFKLKDSDVLVSAPTGSGKTWIALDAIRQCLNQGKRSWYATPLKALSNSKYEEFKAEFSDAAVGILTGDRKENPDAPVIVGTTEILRNQLYDAMHSGSDITVHLVILDEAHYLSDQERGVVWEEVLIYLPSRVKLLLLSATLENSPEIAEWLSQVRGVPCSVVNSETRPVPLVPLFLFPHGHISLFSNKQGLLPHIKNFIEKSRRSTGRKAETSGYYGPIVRHLRTLNLLPAIFFLKSRIDCDKALMSCFPAPPREGDDEFQFNKTLDGFLSQFPFLRGHRQLHSLIQHRVASHHAGQLPQWKLLIERMMNRGMLEAIFSTSTVAAGVNFPARTVALAQSDRYNGKEFTDLTATELHQMTGRAGRRGKDNIGFALILPGTFQDPFLINTLLSSRSEPLKSQIQINFSMALNLLRSYHPAEIKDLLNRSLATFQHNLAREKTAGERGRGPRKAERLGYRLWKDFQHHVDFLKETGFVDSDNHLTSDGLWASQLRLDQPLLIAECIRGRIFDTITPQALAGLIAPFVCDKTKEVEVSLNNSPQLKEFKESFRSMLFEIKPLRKLMELRRFETAPLQFWPSLAVFRWGQGYSWMELMKMTEIEEGDMVMLILRTADNLRQIRSLEDTHPALARKAHEALPLLLREPVLTY